MSQHRGNEESNLPGNDRHDARPSPIPLGKLCEAAQPVCFYLKRSAISERLRAILIGDHSTLFRQRILDRERYHALVRSIHYYCQELESIVDTTHMARSALLKMASSETKQLPPRAAAATAELPRHGTLGESGVLFGLQFSR